MIYAREWYNLDPSFAFEYDSIITNFHEWFFLTYNREKRKYEVIPWEALEDITNIRFFHKMKEKGCYLMKLKVEVLSYGRIHFLERFYRRHRHCD